MKSKNLLLLFVFSLYSFLGMAQEKLSRKEQFEKLHTIKLGMITERLDLSEEQAKDFWPIYNKYENERKSIRSKIHQFYMEERAKGTDRAEIAKQDKIFDLKQEELALPKKYRPEFLKVISPQQFSDWLLVEKEFKELILKELRSRRSRGNH
ncbi:hypothetical protein LAG90_01685 [Marinilongibacter aquaticus]|uniref:hypothetical protein n=1 Tax=Marinilongibacter aquaticus TaxID=2975157 RepID=UPI0021BD6FDF|nr:hypothetical protein [Marinilongibacter aquaticus]UBM59368.1 hypothetical protein LAG90_01685 [Marinilongibacter aquaticus]